MSEEINLSIIKNMIATNNIDVEKVRYFLSLISDDAVKSAFDHDEDRDIYYNALFDIKKYIENPTEKILLIKAVSLLDSIFKREFNDQYRDAYDKFLFDIKKYIENPSEKFVLEKALSLLHGMFK